MGFGIFRRFSHLIHRRTKSDSAILPQISQAAAAPPSSLSMDSIHTRAIDTILPPPPVLSPLFPPPSLSNNDPPYSDAPQSLLGGEPDCTLLRLSAAQKCASELVTQSFQLKTSLEALQVETGYAEMEARKAKNDLEQVRSLANRQKRRSADLEREINARKHELAQCQAFAEALHEGGLITLANPTLSALNADSFEEAAVEAIRETSANDTSIWSRVMSRVIGPRAPDNYVNTIKLTLHARQELRHWKKVSNFWKKTAREGNTDTGIPTPSASNLSDVRECLTDERKKAVEELWEKRKTLGLSPVTSISYDSFASSHKSSTLAYRLPDSQPSFTSVMSTMQNLPSSRSGSTTQSSDRLPPLASDVFKREMFSSHSRQHFFPTSSQRSLRASSVNTTHATISSTPSEKALGKRKAADVLSNISSMPSNCTSLDSNIGHVDKSMIDSSSSSSVPLSSLASFNSTSSRFGVPNTSRLWAASNTKSVHSSLKSAERALESFERLCNRFSSGSNISSLQNISEETSLFDRAPNSPQIWLEQSGSRSSGRSSLIATATLMETAESVELAPRFNHHVEGDTTLVDSGNEGTDQALALQENDRTLIEAEGLDLKGELKMPKEVPPEKSRLPIFRIPARLSQMSRMTGSSSKKSLASFRSRNSSSTISTVDSKDNTGPRSVVKSFAKSFKPIMPLRIIKKTTAGADDSDEACAYTAYI